MSRRGFTLVEISVAAALFSLVIYIVFSAAHLGRTYFLSGQLSHALQGALAVGSRLQDDLRQALRDPKTRAPLSIGADPFPSIAFYRGISLGDDGSIAVVPVKWSLAVDEARKVGYMVRTTWDLESQTWDTQSYRWAPVPVPAGGDDIGFRIAGSAEDDVQSVLLTVLARDRKVDGPGAANDRATIQVNVTVPQLPPLPQPLFRILKKIEEVPK